MKTVDVAGFKIYCTNSMEQFRADTFYSKEPETVEWIKSFQDHDVFYDIGANIGIYSLYCKSLHPTSKVYSFEPVLGNYNRLYENIELNNLNIDIRNIALSNKEGSTVLYIPEDDIATSGGQVGSPIDEDMEEFKPAREQAITTNTLNRLVRKQSFPTHIKIDVDGHEGEILRGATEVLADKRLKSILIEFNNPSDKLLWMYDMTELYGFTMDNRFNTLENHSTIRRGGSPENIIFTREG